MQEFISRVNVHISEHIYLKDPVSSTLGKRIISGSIDLIYDIGFESFTLRKLGQQINSPEASIYRYFENKHKILLYLTSWYWGWMDYRLIFGMANIESPVNRLERALTLLSEDLKEDVSFSHINEVKLHRIVISEASKAYLTKSVDAENEEGAFGTYKQLVSRLSDIVLEINPNYKYPHMLISTVVEGTHFQRYFSRHIPNLTDTVKGEDSVMEFHKEMVFKMLGDYAV